MAAGDVKLLNTLGEAGHRSNIPVVFLHQDFEGLFMLRFHHFELHDIVKGIDSSDRNLKNAFYLLRVVIFCN
jgi:hypothetical protein